MNLILLSQEDCIDHNKYMLCDYRAEHILSILMLNEGDKLQVGLINGETGEAEIDNIKCNEITLTILQLEPCTRSLTIDLICALPRPQTLKKVLFIAGMCGIRNLFLIRSNRVEKSYFQSPLLNEKNYKKYLLEGMSQGKNTQLPKVSIHDRFRNFFDDVLPSFENQAHNSFIKLLPEITTTSDLNDVYSKSDMPVMLSIGPEGGWVPFEVEMMVAQGFKPFKLSDTIYRVEQALMASIAQIELLQKIN